MKYYDVCFVRMKTKQPFRPGWLLLLLLLLSVVPVSADPLAAGDTLPTLILPDQHDRSAMIPGDARWLLVAFERPAADLITAFLEKQPDDFLEQHAALYLMDISAMPKMITRMFALPKMRERPYRILLADDPETLAFLPRREGRVTAIRLDAGRVDRIDFLGDESGLRALF